MQSHFSEKIPMDTAEDVPYFDDISILEVWRLFIDGVKQRENGWVSFETREKGYLQAICKSMAYALSHINNEMDVSFIQHLHKLAMTNVADTRYKEIQEKPGEIRPSEVHYGFPPDILTRRGLTELINKIRKQGFLNLFYFHPLTLDKIPLIPVTPISQKELKMLSNAIYSCVEARQNSIFIEGYNKQKYSENRCQHIEMQLINFIEDYNRSIKKAHNDRNKKIRAILTFVKNCEQMHVFSDGNGRVFYMVLLYFLFAKNNLPLPLMENINHITGHALGELVIKIKEGWQNKQKLSEKQSLFSISTMDILSPLNNEEKQYFISSLKPLQPYFKPSKDFDCVEESVENIHERYKRKCGNLALLKFNALFKKNIVEEKPSATQAKKRKIGF